MTGKERVRTILAGGIPDAVPWGEFAIDGDTVGQVIGRETFYRAKAASTFAFWDGRRDEVVQSWREDGIAFFREMDCLDIVNCAAMASGVAPPAGYRPDKPKKIGVNTWAFRDGRIMKYSEITRDLTLVHDPSAGTRVFTPADFAGEPTIELPNPSCFEVVDAFIEAFGQDRYILGPSGHEVGIMLLGGDFTEGGAGFAHALMQYYDAPDAVRAAYRWETARQNALDAHYIRPGQDAVMFGQQDFASTQGPFISPAMFRDFSLPWIAERVRNVKERFGLPVFKHACGNNGLLLDMFVEAGYDVYQSVQRTAGMDIADIKARYDGRLIPWGGLDVETLVSGTTADVRAGVRDALDRLKPGGGFLFGTSHSVAVGTPYENFRAMADEVNRLRWY